jgi:hypothetical protein
MARKIGIGSLNVEQSPYPRDLHMSDQIHKIRRQYCEVIDPKDELFGKKVEIVEYRENDLLIRQPITGFRLAYKYDEVKLERTDTDRIEWLNKNPHFQIHFIESKNFVTTLKERYPRGYFRVIFGRKDDTNRFVTFRECVDALMDGKFK